jgi:eukaryotic-like serine/threonine-protein kinase
VPVPLAPRPATGFGAAPRSAATSAPPGVRPLGAAKQAEPLPDTIGRYRVLRRLNTGDASDVLLAQSAGPGGFSKWVVIKRVLPELVDDDRAVDMFLREARIAARLNHSSIVQTYELGEDISNGRRGYFVAMEYIDGLSLTALAQKTWAQGKSLPLEVVTATLGDIALGLQYAHELSDDGGEAFGLVHRDVCPDNILVTKTGDAKLVDFGVATMSNLTRFTRDGELRVKIPYTAPEQLKSEDIDGRADLYSLGISLYWLSTATLPFTAKGSMQLMQQVTTLVPPPPSAHNATLPRRFDDLVMKLIAKKATERFTSGEEVYEALLDAVPSSKNDVVAFWSDMASPFAAPPVEAGALPKPGVPAARLRRAMR